VFSGPWDELGHSQEWDPSEKLSFIVKEPFGFTKLQHDAPLSMVSLILHNTFDSKFWVPFYHSSVLWICDPSE
jgi:hypothetical protein